MKPACGWISARGQYLEMMVVKSMTKNPQDVQGFKRLFGCCPSVDNDLDDET